MKKWLPLRLETYNRTNKIQCMIPKSVGKYRRISNQPTSTFYVKDISTNHTGPYWSWRVGFIESVLCVINESWDVSQAKAAPSQCIHSQAGFHIKAPDYWAKAKLLEVMNVTQG